MKQRLIAWLLGAVMMISAVAPVMPVLAEATPAPTSTAAEETASSTTNAPAQDGEADESFFTPENQSETVPTDGVSANTQSTPTSNATTAPVTETPADPTATPAPTAVPTQEPTATPEPTLEPTQVPTATPDPTVEPTQEPTATPEPTNEPTQEPTATPEPTLEPTQVPTATPEPTAVPTVEPLAASISTSQYYGAVNATAVTVQVTITGGTADYTVTVKAQNGGAIEYTETQVFSAPGSYSFTYMPQHSGTHQVLFSLTDGDGNMAQGSLRMPVSARSQDVQVMWEKSVAEAELTGDWALDLVAVARTQKGYTEIEDDFIIDADGKHYFTRYGEWYGNAYGEWCAMFVSFCLYYAGIPEEHFPYEAGVVTWKQKLEKLGVYIDDESSYIPQAGDIIFLNDEGHNQPKHVGIVADVYKDLNVYSIEGNIGTPGEVVVKNHNIDSSDIVGYVSMRQMMDRSGLFTPTPAPTATPSATAEPTATVEPTPTVEATVTPTVEPTATAEPTEEPTAERTATAEPTATVEATVTPTAEPTATAEPTEEPTAEPTATAEPTPTAEATVTPTAEPTATAEPTEEPTAEPTATAEPTPTVEATVTPTTEPTATAEPTEEPTAEPTQEPTVEPTAEPTAEPTPEPTAEPTVTPTVEPTAEPTPEPIVYCGCAYHAHADGCYDENAALVCGEIEHIHTADCAIRPDFMALYGERIAAYEAIDYVTDSDRASGKQLLAEIDALYHKNWLTADEYATLTQRLEQAIYNNVAESGDPYAIKKLKNSGYFSYWSRVSVTDGEEDSASISAAAATYGLVRSAARSSGITTLALGDEAEPSDSQVDSEGGSNADGQVRISKTIDGTDIENVFDITLAVETQENIFEVYNEPDMAVVIVMDVSNTMTRVFGSTTRYEAAMSAAESFLDIYSDSVQGNVSKVGFVAFNTSAHKIFDLSLATSKDQATELKSKMRTGTGNILNAAGYADSSTRFTNIEAGLKMARDMLGTVTNRNKYIIFLSDGFPTTYVKSGYTGYDPNCSSGTPGTDGVFYDSVRGTYCLYGTSYSDKAAIRAREMATSLKNDGIEIFSIGVDVGGQTIKTYLDQCADAAFAVVDRTSSTYEIGSASSTAAYQNWLRNSIGSGYYYDSNNVSELNAAYESIFSEITTMNKESASADWVTSDPIPAELEFIGFYDQSGDLVTPILDGENGENAENTATYASSTILWDLKHSGYVLNTVTSDSSSTSTYQYELTYRVRLKNERSGFAENTVYNTNDATTLSYRIIENDLVTDTKTLEYPIPAVHGYLVNLTFTKVDTFGNPLSGAEFTLTHHPDCNICRGNGTQVPKIGPYIKTSGSDGTVEFTKIPSGHTYMLEETGVPTGYTANTNTYLLTAAYNKATVTVLDQSGNTLPWDKTIVNHSPFVLPETGASGTLLYTVGGAAMALASAVLLYKTKKYRKEGNGN